MSDGDANNPNSFSADLVEIIQSSKVFAGIDTAACEALLPSLERIILNQGETLFEQGDPSDCLYILVDGQLIAQLLSHEGINKIVGTIDKGETVGELGALSSRHRSLTVRAAVDSKLLKLNRDKFEQFCIEQPGFISGIIDLIITRSQNTLRLISKKKVHRHIAILAGNQFAPLDNFLKKLKEIFESDSSFVFLDDMNGDSLPSDLIDKIENENKSAIFILNENNYKNAQSKFNHINSIYILVDGDIHSPLSDFALKILDKSGTPFVSQYELVLMHDDHIDAPTRTREWLTQADFTLHHHVRINHDEDYHRVKRFMQGKAVGVIFGGGGQKGWGGIGALKALLDAKIPIDAVGGTSVGALAAALYAKNLSYDKTLTEFTKNSAASRHFFALHKLTLPLISVITSKSQTNALINSFQDTQIEDLWLPFFAITSNLSTGKEVVHRRGLVWEKIRASAALPGIAPPVVMDGEIHYDGGLLNNLPVDRMRALLGNEGVTIAVTLSGHSHKPIHYHFPPIVSFWVSLIKLLNLGYKHYKFPPFFNTFLNALLIGASSKENTNKLITDILITPDFNKFRLLKLNNKNIQDMIEISCKATLERLHDSKIFEIKPK